MQNEISPDQILQDIEAYIEMGEFENALKRALLLGDFLDCSHLMIILGKINNAKKDFFKSIAPYETYQQYQDSLIDSFHQELRAIRLNLFASGHNNVREAVGLPTEHFFGRQKLLEDIADNFKQGRRIQILHGMDGMGKSELALQYAYKYTRQGWYSTFVWWVRASDDETLRQGILELAQRVCPIEAVDAHLESTQKERLEKFYHWLGGQKSWLMVFDDVPHLRTLRDYFPYSEGGHILITTPDPFWDEGLPKAKLVSVNGLDVSSSIELLKAKNQEHLAEEEILMIAEAAQGHPLLLNLWGAFYRDGVEKNWEMFDFAQHDIELKDKIDRLAQSIVNTLKRTRGIWSRFGFASALCILAWFDHQKIPKYFFSKLVDGTIGRTPIDEEKVWIKFFARLVNALGKRASRRAHIARVGLLTALLRKSFIEEVERDFYRIHPLLQQYLQRNLSAIIRQKEGGAFFKISHVRRELAKIISKRPRNNATDKGRPQHEHRLVLNILLFVSDTLLDELRYKKDDADSWKKCQMLLPHAGLLLDKVRHYRVVGPSFLRLSRKVSDLFFDLGEYKKAELYASFTQQLEEELHGHSTFDTLMQAAGTAMTAGQFQAMSAYLERAKTAQGYHFGKEMVMQGFESYLSGNFSHALSCLEKAIQIIREEDEEEDALAALYAFTGFVAAHTEKGEKFEAYFEQAHALEDSSADSESYANTLFLEACALATRSRYSADSPDGEILHEKAMGLFERAYNTVSQKKGESSVNACAIAMEKGNAAMYYGNRLEVALCAAQLEKNMPQLLETLGEDNYILADLRIMQAYLTYHDDRFDDCDTLLNEATRIYQKHFPDQPDHSKFQTIAEIRNWHR